MTCETRALNIDNPFGDHRRPSKFGLSVCDKAIVGARQAIPKASGAILGAILGVWKAMLGGYVVHLGPWKAHVADLGGHLVAKSAAKSQHELTT